MKLLDHTDELDSPIGDNERSRPAIGTGELGDQLTESQPSLVHEQARTGTFGGQKLDGTIEEGYQLNAFDTPEDVAAS